MNGVEEDEIALKMRKKELRRVEKEKAAAQKKAAAERQQIEYRRFLKEMNREDPDFDKMAAKLPEAERLANEEEFLAMYAKLQAERAAAVKAAEDKKEVLRLQLPMHCAAPVIGEHLMDELVTYMSKWVPWGDVKAVSFRNIVDEVP